MDTASINLFSTFVLEGSTAPSTANAIGHVARRIRKPTPQVCCLIRTGVEAPVTPVLLKLQSREQQLSTVIALNFHFAEWRSSDQ